MNVCRNIKSGKYFILIQEVDWDRIETVTPLNQIKILERRLFADELEEPEAHFLRSGLISRKQLKVYNDYERFHIDDNKKFVPQKPIPSKRKPVSAIKSQEINIIQKKVGRTMKTIEIDDQVYNFLEAEAKPFEETTPNQVIRRLLGLNKQPIKPEPTVKPASRPTSAIRPKADLKALIQNGVLREGQRLYLDYKGRTFSKEYQAEIQQSKLLYNEQLYTMSGLVKGILEKEGTGIPSQSYRGPEYWRTSQGESIRELWDTFLAVLTHT